MSIILNDKYTAVFAGTALITGFDVYLKRTAVGVYNLGDPLRFDVFYGFGMPRAAFKDIITIYTAHFRIFYNHTQKKIRLLTGSFIFNYQSALTISASGAFFLTLSIPLRQPAFAL